MKRGVLLIFLENISKTYGSGNMQTVALKNISLHVEKGCFCSIVGTSGSGKSTLLNIVGCLDIADSGRYILDGETIFKEEVKKLSYIRNNKIGFIFQNFNLIKGLNIYENVELPLVFSGVSPKKRREIVENAIELVGLSDRMYHKPNELSGGQQQRVAIARAVVNKPPLILADEPTGNLDTASGNEVMGLLRKLNHNGTTVLMITHDMSRVKDTDKIIRIQEGEIK